MENEVTKEQAGLRGALNEGQKEEKKMTRAEVEGKFEEMLEKLGEAYIGTFGYADIPPLEKQAALKKAVGDFAKFIGSFVSENRKEIDLLKEKVDKQGKWIEAVTKDQNISTDGFVTTNSPHI